MTTDRFEQDLRVVLREDLPDEAPLTLRLLVARIAEATPPALQATGIQARRLAWILLATAAILAALAASALFIASRQDRLPRHPEALVPSGIAVLTPVDGYDDMVSDVDGTLWAISSGRLARLDPANGTVRTWTAADDAAFATVATGRWFDSPAAIFPSPEAGVWLIGDGVLRWFDGDAYRDVVEAPAGIRDATEAPDGSLWVATERGDVLRWDGSSWASLPDPLPGAEDPIATVTVGPDGQAWVGGEGWVARWDGSAWTTLGAVDTPLFDGTVVAFDPAPDASAWVVTPTALALFDGSTWTLAASAPWGEASATSAARAPDGSLWVAGGSGIFGPPGFVSRLDGHSWVTYGPGDGLPEGTAWAVVSTSSGTYALAGGAIHEFREVPRAGATDDCPLGQWRRVWPPEEPSADVPGDTGTLLAVSHDELWTAADDGIWHFSDGTWTNERPMPADGLRSDLAVARDGSLWTAGPDGVANRRETQWTVVDPNVAEAVTVSTDGAVYAGVGSDVWRLRPDGERWSRETLPGAPLPAESATYPDRGLSLAVGADGTLWAGATGLRYLGGPDADIPGGLARFDGRSWDTIAEIEGFGLYGARVLGTGPDGRVRVEGWVRANDEQLALDPDPVHLLVAAFDGTGWTALEAPDGTCGLAMAPDGSIWASTPRGPALSDGRRWTFPYTGLSVGCSYDADGLAVAADGTLFIDHDRGIWSFAAP